MRIYFDACCVNRLTDDHSQERILREAEAIEALIGFATRASNVWAGSAVLEAELSRNPDSDRRADAQELLAFAKEVVKLDDGIIAVLVIYGRLDSPNLTRFILRAPKPDK